MISSGLIGGLVAAVLVSLVVGSKSLLAKRLLPAGAALLAFSFSALCFYVYFFVGSSAPDADEQMRACLQVAVALLLGGVLVLLTSYWPKRH
ncbi:MAG: hypothetical protein KKA45_01875 [Alphaproteobacteria bacterium]|nr:hypothetical protein [Alphaproteobacteria bacterium]